MSTFLVSLGVILVAVAFVTWLALRDPDQRGNPDQRRVSDQRATGRRTKRRDHPRTSAPAKRFPQPDSFVYVPGGRVRAGLALTVLVTFVGAVVALTVAGGIVFLAQGLRNTVR
ncbi:MAG: hypothetical protein M3159_03450 [Actinomycetota bacterium]|nr:hypothetical protein [Actinomycetota bacterium]